MMRDNFPATGRSARATTVHPRPRSMSLSRHTSRAAPIHNKAGATNAQYDTEIVGTPSGARTI
jgi:hypothetical protein